MIGRPAIITGCTTGGIGSALAIEFQKRNVHVFATARDLAKMSHLKDTPNITLLTIDVTSPSSIKEAMDTVAAKTGGKLDYLVNNAGSMIVMPTLDIDIDAAKAMYEINIWVMLRVKQAFASMVIEARGKVVAISSAGPLAPVPWVGKFSQPNYSRHCLIGD